MFSHSREAIEDRAIRKKVLNGHHYMMDWIVKLDPKVKIVVLVNSYWEINIAIAWIDDHSVISKSIEWCLIKFNFNEHFDYVQEKVVRATLYSAMIMRNISMLLNVTSESYAIQWNPLCQDNRRRTCLISNSYFIHLYELEKLKKVQLPAGFESGQEGSQSDPCFIKCYRVSCCERIELVPIDRFEKNPVPYQHKFPRMKTLLLREWMQQDIP